MYMLELDRVESNCREEPGSPGGQVSYELAMSLLQQKEQQQSSGLYRGRVACSSREMIPLICSALERPSRTLGTVLGFPM